MVIYLVPFVAVALFSLIALDKSVRTAQIIPLFFFVIALFVGLRYASVDYFSYADIFSYIDSFEELAFPNYVPDTGEKPVEALYSLLTLVVKSLGGNYGIFVFVVAVISIAIKFYAFKRMSNFFYLSLLLYVGQWMGKDMGQIRNALASAIVLLSVLYVYDRRFIKFHLAALSAMLIHLIGALSFLLYYVKPFSRPILMAVVLTASFAMAAYGGLGMKMVEQLAMLAGLDNEFRLVRYMDSKYAESYSLLGGTVLLHTVISIVSILFYKKLVVANRYNAVFIPMYVYGFAMMLFFVDYGIVFTRIKDLFCLPASMILIPSMVLLFSSKSRIIAYIGIIFFAGFMFAFSAPNEPYTTILFN